MSAWFIVFSAPPVNGHVAVGAPGCPKGSTICYALVAIAQAGGGSSVLNLLCVKIQANENCEHRLWRGLLGVFFPLLFPPVLQLLSPGTWAWLKHTVPGFRTQWKSGSWCLIEKHSVRDRVIGKRWICSDSERSALHRVWTITEGECSGYGMWCG